MPDRRIGRQYIQNRAERAFTAFAPCLLQIWATPVRGGQGLRDAVVYWEVDPAHCSLAEGIPLVLGQMAVTVMLEPGDSIFAICEDEALLGWSVTEVFEE